MRKPIRTYQSKKFKANTITSVEMKVEPPETPLNNDDILLDANFVSESHSSGAVEVKKEIETNYETCHRESETSLLDSEIKIEYEEIDLKTEWMNETNKTSNIESSESKIKACYNSLSKNCDKYQLGHQIQNCYSKSPQICYGEPETYRLNSEIKLKIEYEETDVKTECMNETNETSDVEALKPNIKDYENIFVLSTEEVVNKEEERKKLDEDSPQEVAEDKSDVTGGHFEFIAINHSESFEENSNHLEENLDSDRHMFIHSRRKTNKEKEPFKCDVCGKLFSQKGGLKRHSLTHTGEKPHRCDTCGKLFTHRFNLNTHKLIHTGEKPYKCDICGESFAHPFSLNTHKLIHTGENPHKCDMWKII